MKLNLFLVVFLFSFSGSAEVATFGGGCFWCMEPPYEGLEGVSSVISGYMGGSKENADYKKVSSGMTKHLEVVQITYDPKKISYKELVKIFWRNVDPTQADGQFNDKGDQYKTVIFFHDQAQKTTALESKKRLEESGKFKKPIVTKIIPAKKFFPAEDYHQDYYKKNTLRYKYYRYLSGRDDFIEKHWGKTRK